MHNLETLGGLKCHVLDDLNDGQKPELVVVLAHGFGAGGDDLVSVGRALLRAVPRLAETTRFIFPAAPLSLDSIGMTGGRAWWMIDVNQLTEAARTGTFRNLTKDNPEGLPAAREKFVALLDYLQAEVGMSMSRIVIGGFSQGAMLATDVALRLPEPPAALAIWSGTLLCEDTWRELAQKRGSLRIQQSHGYEDSILPFTAAIWLRNVLLENGLDVNLIEFNGGHAIPNLVLQRFMELLLEIVGE